MIEIIIARHAESIANTQGIYQGQSYDTDLSEKGKNQAKALAKTVGDKFHIIDHVYSSPLKRTMQTASEICERILHAAPITDDRLMEIGHGLWEGKSKVEIEQQFPGQLDSYQNDPENIQMPEGETLQEVLDRAYEFMEEIHNTDKTRVVVVTHDMVIRVLLTKFLRRQLKDVWLYELDSAGYSIIEWNGKLPQVAAINVNDHLESIRSDLSVHAI